MKYIKKVIFTICIIFCLTPSIPNNNLKHKLLHLQRIYVLSTTFFITFLQGGTFMHLFNLKSIQEMDPEEVLNAAIKTIFDLKPIRLKLKKMNELVYTMPIKAEFSKVKPYIEYQEYNDMFELIVPIFDERELPEFQVRLFRNDINDCFPERGFYIIGNSHLIVNPLGLIQLEMNSFPIIRVNKDIRYTQTDNNLKGKGYKEDLLFYYDYDSSTFKKVYSDRLAECKYKMKQNPQIIDTYHKNVQEYIKRELLINIIKERVYPLSLPYLQNLKKWSTYEYGNGGLTIGSITDYLRSYQEFIENDMIKNLKIKLLYANITVREYKKILDKANELKSLIHTAFKGLDRITKLQLLTNENQRSYLLNRNSIFQEEIDITNQLEYHILRELQNFKEVRPTEFPSTALNKDKLLKGYIDYDLSTNEVFPNIMQIQRRASLTEEKEDFRSEEEYILNLLRELK